MTPKKRFKYRKGSESGWNWCSRCMYCQPRTVNGVKHFRELGGTCLQMEMPGKSDGPHNRITPEHTCNLFKEGR